MLVPYRKPKRSYVLPVVTILAVTAPIGALALSDAPAYRDTEKRNLAAIPANVAELALAAAPDVVLPLRDITGLPLPDLRLSDLRMLPLPASIRIPENLPLPPGVELPSEIPLPRLDQPARTPVGPFTAAPGFIADPGAADSQITPDPQAPSAPDSEFHTAPGESGTVQAPAPAAPEGPAVPGANAPEAPAADVPAAQQPHLDPETGEETHAPAQPAAPVIGGDPDRPALAPGVVPNDLVDQVGAQVKEITRDTPFSMVALTAKELVGTTTMIRAKAPDGSWGPWYEAEPVDTTSADGVTDARTGTEPIYVGDTKSVQILVTRKPASTTSAGTIGTDPAQPVDPAQPPGDPAQPPGDPAQSPADPAVVPRTDAAAGDPAQIGLEALSAVLIDPGRGAIDATLSEVAAPLPGGGPKVISRAQWGADENMRCQDPTYDRDGVAGITLHHTAGRNDYSKAESAGIVRAIYAYHAKTLGWCDIGYNALVDKYGQIFEGRAGGLDKPVQGAHAGGFNENTAGVSFMGNHEEQAPSEAAVRSMGEFIGWRAKVAGLDPEGTTTMISEGSSYTPYALGEEVRLPIVFAHRDVGNTSCPGDAAYGLMDRIRSIAEDASGGVSPQQELPSPPRSRTDQRADQQQSIDPEADADLAALADLTTLLLDMLDRSAVARTWNEQGGAAGPLGAPISEPRPTVDGGQYVQFANGIAYSTPDGRVYQVVGKILERFIQLGAFTGLLGMPTSSEYEVPDGVRADFQYGSLIFNRVTGIITTILDTFGTSQSPAGAPIPQPLAQAPAADPIPAPLPAP
ncbi:N-acetylmuramoyl-L-alanine amidase [Nocardia otitidiscaviarum]|uniref:N-acetylmuramoyl-L-alanine amidase n=1 Tax=Nocardia otitidiscaviarum TaxID=1823 RepID=UPI001892D6B8|nr:N-acetylmuramoyl-L-alanine amidase [Nocardia otitidiscaviarum]MBF6135995.1 N-acetylmuramoyl-L-alanine amidase [Nocardia otitidiscaviarum]